MGMKVRLSALSLVVAVGLSGSPATAQFNPQGRSKKAKPAKPRPRTSPAAPAPAGDTPKPKEAPAVPNAGAPSAKAPSKDILIARYMSALLSQPGADFPLERLAELYRERDGSLAALVRDLEARASGSGAERYAALLGLAGLHRVEGRFDQAFTAYERALALEPQNPAADLAIARLL
jgi:tetratricopeptide (TPR) repeat protein